MTAEKEIHINIAQKSIDIALQLRKIAQLLVLNIWLLETIQRFGRQNFLPFSSKQLPLYNHIYLLVKIT